MQQSTKKNGQEYENKNTDWNSDCSTESSYYLSLSQFYLNCRGFYLESCCIFLWWKGKLFITSDNYWDFSGFVNVFIMLIDPKKFERFNVSLTERDVHFCMVPLTMYNVCTARSQTQVESVLWIWTYSM